MQDIKQGIQTFILLICKAGHGQHTYRKCGDQCHCDAFKMCVHRNSPQKVIHERIAPVVKYGVNIPSGQLAPFLRWTITAFNLSSIV